MGEPLDGTKTKEIEHAAGGFFVLAFIMIMLSYSLYDKGMSWGLMALAVSIASAMMFALSGILSRRSSTRRAKVPLVAGMIGLAGSLISVVIIAMQYVSEHSN